jgi:hypothetical protein
VITPYTAQDPELWLAKNLEEYPGFLSQVSRSPDLWLLEMDEPANGSAKIPFFFGTSVAWHQGPPQITTALGPAADIFSDPVVRQFATVYDSVDEKRFPGLRLFYFHNPHAESYQAARR